jgi:hypothetical protein
VRGGGRAGRGDQKGRGRRDVAGERADVGVSTAGRSWARGQGRLTGGDGGIERESRREGRERRRQLGPTEQRESEGVSALGLAPTGGARLSGTEGTRAWARVRARLNGLAWAEMAFSFFLEFLLPFLFIFSRFFNSNSNQVSNSNQIKYVQQFKEYLGSI